MQTQARNLVEKNTLKNKSRIGFVADYIKKNLHQKLSIDTIAKMAYVSKSNFFKMFKEELGLSPNEYITQERIKKAKELLIQNNSVSETAFSTGFLTPTTLSGFLNKWKVLLLKSFRPRSYFKLNIIVSYRYFQKEDEQIDICSSSIFDILPKEFLVLIGIISRTFQNRTFFFNSCQSESFIIWINRRI
jgi:AraC-like DNA-binding protein